ncbi:unnamed protein product [Nezara viridula]|uniref:Uncharacterized protein n=1 Tax=Nezara viridula TaxID=85310 RepID=A0A9P0MMI4_NEZVI|nr:unnamed protein product [Nezara viridula]
MAALFTSHKAPPPTDVCLPSQGRRKECRTPLRRSRLHRSLLMPEGTLAPASGPHRRFKTSLTPCPPSQFSSQLPQQAGSRLS